METKNYYVMTFLVKIKINENIYVKDSFVKIQGLKTFHSAFLRTLKTAELFNSLSPDIQIVNAGVYIDKDRENKKDEH